MKKLTSFLDQILNKLHGYFSQENTNVLNEYEKVRRQVKPLPIKKALASQGQQNRDISAI